MTYDDIFYIKNDVIFVYLDENMESSIPLCQKITVLNHSAYIDGEGQSITVAFTNSDSGKEVIQSFLKEDIVLRPRKCMNQLIKFGFEVFVQSKIGFIVSNIARYILSTSPTQGKNKITRWLGWVDDVYYFPESAFSFGNGKLSSSVQFLPDNEEYPRAIASI